MNINMHKQDTLLCDTNEDKFPCPLQLHFCSLFDYSHLPGIKILHWAFDLHFPDNYDAEHQVHVENFYYSF